MSRFFYKPYVPVAERRRRAEKHLAALRRKGGTVEPVAAATPRGRIAASFWGHAWCDHLESYSDFANRLPRGRSYLRNGSVIHLGVETGCIRALVMGSELYEQTVRIGPLPAAKWKTVRKRCQGKIGSLVELLQGRLSDEIMAVVTDRKAGLFPAPKEIHLNCSCPDWASLCKHLAAVLYGVGARLDEAPELLFKLRGVDHAELVRTDTDALVKRGSGSRRRLAPSALGEVFGIDLDDAEAPAAEPARKSGTKRPAPKPSEATGTLKKGPPTPGKAKQKKAVRAAPFRPTAAGVRQLRDRLGLSRAAFADRLGVTAQSVANWEGKSGELRLQPGSLAALRKLHRAAGPRVTDRRATR